MSFSRARGARKKKFLTILLPFDLRCSGRRAACDKTVVLQPTGLPLHKEPMISLRRRSSFRAVHRIAAASCYILTSRESALPNSTNRNYQRPMGAAAASDAVLPSAGISVSEWIAEWHSVLCWPSPLV